MLNPYAAKMAAIAPAPDPNWLALHTEEIIEPDLPIVDAHHHIWDEPRVPRYLQSEIARDVLSGHNIVATVFVECTERYRDSGPELLRPLGETEFVRDFAAEALLGPAASKGICAAIVGRADLTLGSEVEELLVQHVELGRGRFRGIRQSTAYEDTGTVRSTARIPPAQVLMNPAFREGFSKLDKMGLTFDSWVYHTQLAEVADLARAFPGTKIVLNHSGGPIGSGVYANKRMQVFADWSEGIKQVAQCPNVVCKIGGLASKFSGFGFYDLERPAHSSVLADAWGPYIHHCIDQFGPDRCMFESDFPVEMISCSYAVMWNVYKRIAAPYSEAEKSLMFSETAKRVYSIDL